MAILGCALPRPVEAQDDPSVPPETQAEYVLPQPGLATSVDALWFEPTPAIGPLRTLRVERGIEALPGHGSALAARGFATLESGDSIGAQTSFEEALELDPASTDALLGLAAIEAEAGVVNPRVLSQLLAATRARLARLTSMPFAVASWLSILALGMTLAGIVIVAALLARHNGPVRHDIEERIKRTLDPRLGRALGWLILLLPLVIRFDLYWAAVWWAILLAAYLDLRERIVLVLGVVMMAASTPVVAVATSLLTSAAEPYNRAASLHIESYLDTRGTQRLEEAIASGGAGTEARMLLGLVYERDGEPRRALGAFTDLADSTRSPEVYNNLGNVHYRLDEQDKAFENWSRALELDAGFAPAHYNLSQYYIDHFQFDKKEEHFNRAIDADPLLINTFVREQGDRKGSGSGLIDSGVDPTQIRRRLWEGAGGAASASLRSVNVAAAMAALIVGFVLALRRKDVAAACDKCGQAYCPYCRPAKDAGRLCSQCVHLFQRRDGVSPQMRIEKMAQIETHQKVERLRAIALSLLLPGSGQVAQRQTLLGFALATLWSLSLAVWLQRGQSPLEPGVLASALAIYPAWAGLVGVAVTWLVANVTTLVSRG